MSDIHYISIKFPRIYKFIDIKLSKFKSSILQCRHLQEIIFSFIDEPLFSIDQDTLKLQNQNLIFGARSPPEISLTTFFDIDSVLQSNVFAHGDLFNVHIPDHMERGNIVVTLNVSIMLMNLNVYVVLYVCCGNLTLFSASDGRIWTAPIDEDIINKFKRSILVPEKDFLYYLSTSIKEHFQMQEIWSI